MRILRIVTLLIIVPVHVSVAQDYPLSDPGNSGGWTLNAHMSDEFDGAELDRSKWWILGEAIDGERTYRNKWKGRAPGQFVGHNVFLEDGELVLRSQWEPEFEFVAEKHAATGTWYGGTTTAADNSSPITQSCILSEGMFKYGYVEARYKAADAPVTNAVWTTGYRSEIDMTENFGKRPISNPESKPASLERLNRTNIISWEPNLPDGHKNWKVSKDMGVRLAEDYHVYGFEWDRDYVKTYFNGELVQSISRFELENWEYAPGKYYNQWVIKHPMELWMDMEVFYWYGLPEAEDMVQPAEHHYDYIRIWQKEIAGPEFHALGFEGPFYHKYGDMEHKRSLNWWSPNGSPYLLTDEKAASGDCSLAFKQSSVITTNQTIFAPFGSLNLPGGDNVLSFKVWKEPNTQIDKIYFKLSNPSTLLSKDVSNIETGKWVDLSISFNRSTSVLTGNADRIEIQIRSADVSGSDNTLYIDDIVFENDNNSYVPPVTSNKIEKYTMDHKVYPNPASDFLRISSPDSEEVIVYNILGSVMKRETVDSELYELNVSDLSSGLYIVAIKSARGTVGRKIQVRR